MNVNVILDTSFAMRKKKKQAATADIDKSPKAAEASVENAADQNKGTGRSTSQKRRSLSSLFKKSGNESQRARSMEGKQRRRSESTDISKSRNRQAGIESADEVDQSFTVNPRLEPRHHLRRMTVREALVESRVRGRSPNRGTVKLEQRILDNILDSTRNSLSTSLPDIFDQFSNHNCGDEMDSSYLKPVGTTLPRTGQRRVHSEGRINSEQSIANQILPLDKRKYLINQGHRNVNSNTAENKNRTNNEEHFVEIHSPLTTHSSNELPKQYNQPFIQQENLRESFAQFLELRDTKPPSSTSSSLTHVKSATSVSDERRSRIDSFKERSTVEDFPYIDDIGKQVQPSSDLDTCVKTCIQCNIPQDKPRASQVSKNVEQSCESNIKESMQNDHTKQRFGFNKTTGGSATANELSTTMSNDGTSRRSSYVSPRRFSHASRTSGKSNKSNKSNEHIKSLSSDEVELRLPIPDAASGRYQRQFSNINEKTKSKLSVGSKSEQPTEHTQIEPEIEIKSKQDLGESISKLPENKTEMPNKDDNKEHAELSTPNLPIEPNTFELKKIEPKISSGKGAFKALIRKHVISKPIAKKTEDSRNISDDEKDTTLKAVDSSENTIQIIETEHNTERENMFKPIKDAHLYDAIETELLDDVFENEYNAETNEAISNIPPPDKNIIGIQVLVPAEVLLCEEFAPILMDSSAETHKVEDTRQGEFNQIEIIKHEEEIPNISELTKSKSKKSAKKGKKEMKIEKEREGETSSKKKKDKQEKKKREKEIEDENISKAKKERKEKKKHEQEKADEIISKRKKDKKETKKHEQEKVDEPISKMKKGKKEKKKHEQEISDQTNVKLTSVYKDDETNGQKKIVKHKKELKKGKEKTENSNIENTEEKKIVDEICHEDVNTQDVLTDHEIKPVLKAKKSKEESRKSQKKSKGIFKKNHEGKTESSLAKSIIKIGRTASLSNIYDSTENMRSEKIPQRCKSVEPKRHHSLEDLSQFNKHPDISGNGTKKHKHRKESQNDISDIKPTVTKDDNPPARLSIAAIIAIRAKITRMKKAIQLRKEAEEKKLNEESLKPELDTSEAQDDSTNENAEISDINQARIVYENEVNTSLGIQDEIKEDSIVDDELIEADIDNEIKKLVYERKIHFQTNYGDDTISEEEMIKQRQHNTRLTSRRESKVRQRQRKVISCCKKFVAFLFSHIGLCSLVVAYCILGGFIFQRLEGAEELKQKREMVGLRNDYREKIFLLAFEERLTKAKREVFRVQVEEILKNYSMNIYKQTKEAGWDGKDDSLVPEQWSFPSSLLYAITVMTTIGAISLASKEQWQKNNKRGSIVNGVSTIEFAATLQALRDAFRNLAGKMRIGVGTGSYLLPKAHESWLNGYGHVAPKTDYGRIVTIAYAVLGIPLTLLCLTNIGDVMAHGFRMLYGKVLCGVCCIIFRPSRRKRLDLEKGLPDERMVMVEEEKSQEVVNVPTSVCLLLMSAYVMLGTLLFCEWEGWDMVTGTYFCFITLSTIGFGDVVPGMSSTDWDTNEKLVLCACYLIFGLSLIAMCFNLVQEDVKAKCKWLGMKLGIIDKPVSSV